MNCIIPFESKVKFTTPVKEICSISLEHEITQNDHEILGNFIITGTYKEHELSINTSNFKFTVPFSVDLANRINHDTLEFSIDNFTYDLVGNDMNIFIDYALYAEDAKEDGCREEMRDVDPLDLIIEDNQEPVEKKIELEETLSQEDPERTIDGTTEKGEEIPQEDEVKESSTELRDNNTEANRTENVNEACKEMQDTNSREMIMPENISSLGTENDYLTYHVHIVKETDSLESIAMHYKIDKDDIIKLNNIENVTLNDKLIIPINNE